MPSFQGKYILLAFIFVTYFSIALEPTFAQEKYNVFEQKIEEYSERFNSLEQAVSRQKLDDSGLAETQNENEALQAEVRQYQTDIAPALEDIKTQVDRLGPAPKDKDETEPATVATERVQLQKKLGILDAGDKKAALLLTQMQQLQQQVQDLRLAIFTREIFRRYQSPLNLNVWTRFQEDISVSRERFQVILQDLNSISISTLQFISFILFALVVWGGLYAISLRFVTVLRAPPQNTDEFSFFHRATGAALVTIVRLVPAATALGILYLGASTLDFFGPQFKPLIQTIFFAVFIFVTVSVLSQTLLAIRNPIWRLYPLSDYAAKSLNILIQAIAFVFAINISWLELSNTINAPLSLTVSQSFIASIIFAVLLLAITSIRLRRDQNDFHSHKVLSFLWPIWLKVPLGVLAFTIIISATFGYIPLAGFLASQIVVSGATLAMAILFHIAINEFSSELQKQHSSLSLWFQRIFHLDGIRLKQISFLIGTLLNILLLTLLIPLLLLEWGFSWNDIQSWLNIAIFGVQVGSVNLSLSSLFIALCVFIIGILLTRFLQGWLDAGPLMANMQNGVANSVRTGIGYVGFIISLLLAISYIGFDFTNVAIVAGALSVGIGFGLQSIVSNFVSGVILLVERPVKVGDWVIVGDQQGIVRKISVRSTEVETFDRSSVIIPNSELITNQVTNWTHGNSIGRIIINIGVSYDSDAQQVYDILMDIGKSHPKSLQYPEPLVVFEEFGASSLDFTLRVYIADIRSSLSVRTQLRMAILKAFREKDIEIPFPQRDLNIKSPANVNVQIDGK
ncbi:MAG: DUF3772 domain-containing protein [Pseudomonadota bacterium]